MKSVKQAVVPKPARSQGATNGAAHASNGAAELTSPRPRRVQVRNSGVHGKGGFAGRTLEPGERLIEYTGKVITWEEALERHPHDPSQPDHTFYFHIDEERVIDGIQGGNASRWINHSCDPNCDTDEVDGRVYIVALRPIAEGEELFYDYRLMIDERYTPALKKRFACRCGAAGCRGTMLAPKRAPRR